MTTSYNDPVINGKTEYCMYPIKYHNLWNLYKKAISSFWIVEEIDLGKDVADWENKLSPDDRKFIENVLGFFAVSDGIVIENLAVRFMNDVKISEAKAFYGFQIAMETIHAEMYSLLINTFIKSIEKKTRLFKSIETNKVVKMKAEWAKKWIDSNTSSFAERLIAFVVVEGVFFSASFCAIFWLKHRKLMPGLCKSNEFISRDEALHCIFGIELYKSLQNKLPEKKIHEIFASAVEIEDKFIEDSINKNGLIDINQEDMKKYIRYVADFWLNKLNYANLYNESNPFDWMIMISMQGLTNFFEQRSSEYQRNPKKISKLELTDDF